MLGVLGCAVREAGAAGNTIVTGSLGLRAGALRPVRAQRVIWRIAEACGPDGVMELRGRNLRT